MKKLFKNALESINTVEAYELRAACSCNCSCGCGCQCVGNEAYANNEESVGKRTYGGDYNPIKTPAYNRAN